MSTIISGRFQTQDEISFAIGELEKIGFPRAAISSFYVNPAGQHDLYPIGGDRAMSPGAKETAEGVAAGVSAGGAVGAAVGAATAPVTGAAGPVFGALVGGHIGSLVGGMKSTKEHGESEEGAAGAENVLPQRTSGMLVAVATATPQQEEDAVALLCSLHGHQIERNDGTIVDGDWTDFDPLSTPHVIADSGQSAV
ncbi:MAG: hypothetical protein JWP38_3599 [Herbaspirillum sp.]|nr:hypothetical protein [Herbaspirillum sp.]